MSQRTRLPNRRSSESFIFEVDGLHFTATVSRFPNGEIAELFLNNDKAGNQADTFALDAANLASIAMQFGATADDLRQAFLRDAHGQPSTPIRRALDLLSAEER
jgi:hypothetical protein